MHMWMDENKMTYEKIAPHNPDCEKIFKEGSPEITSPVSNTEYLINKKDREPLQLICKTADDVSKLYWYINNKFLQGNAGAKQLFTPDERPIKISCTDDKGRNIDIWIKVRYVS